MQNNNMKNKKVHKKRKKRKENQIKESKTNWQKMWSFIAFLWTTFNLFLILFVIYSLGPSVFKCIFMVYDWLHNRSFSARQSAQDMSYENILFTPLTPDTQINNNTVHWKFPNSLFELTEQKEAKTFSQVLNGLSTNYRVVSVSPYSRVYQASSRTGPVFKILEVKADTIDRCSELVVTRQLDKLRAGKIEQYLAPNFPEIQNAFVVVDSNGYDFLENIKSFENKTNEQSPSPNPNVSPLPQDDEGTSMDKMEQRTPEAKPSHYLVLQMKHAGVPVKLYDFRENRQITSLVLQLVLALSTAERAMQFEHRNLTLDCLLVNTTAESDIKYVIRDRSILIASFGVFLTITGFRLSRITLNGDTTVCHESTMEEQSQSVGYNIMDGLLRQNWQQYAPQTNLAWLSQLFNELKPVVKKMGEPFHIMESLKKETMTFSSVADMVVCSTMVRRLLLRHGYE